jgi:hypothetical protein
MPYALLGLTLSVLLDIYRSGISVDKFSWKKWISENFFRILISLICLVAGLLFSEDIFGLKINALTAFWGGVGNDNLINTFIRRKENINKPTEENKS